MLLRLSICIYPNWVSLGFLDCKFAKFVKSSTIVSPPKCSVPFSVSFPAWDSTYAHFGNVILFHGYLSLCSFFINHPLHLSEWIISIAMSLSSSGPSFAITSLPWNSSDKYFISVILLFSLIISIWFYCYIFHIFAGIPYLFPH